MSLLISTLIGGKLKLLSSVTITGVSASSIPIALASDKSNNSTSITPKEISKASQFLESHFSDVPQKLREKYSGGGQEIVDSAKEETIEHLREQWHGGQEAVEGSYEYLRENSEEINYYLMTLQNLWKSLALMFPKIIRDTIVHNDETKLEQQLLSIQKIIAVAQKDEFKKLSPDLIQLLKDHHRILKTLSMKDGEGVWKILREVREVDYGTFLKQIKENVKEIKTKQSNHYKSATDLLQDIFVGRNNLEKLKETQAELKQLIEQVKETLKKIKGLDDDQLNHLESILPQTSEQSTPAS